MDQKWTMTITDVIDNETKCLIEIELDEEFEKGFMDVHELRKWNSGKFKEWFKGVLWRALISLEKGGYETIYDKYGGGSTDDAEVGDIMSFWKENGGEYTRVIEKIGRGILITELLWETDKSIKVKTKNVTRIIRKLT